MTQEWQPARMRFVHPRNYPEHPLLPRAELARKIIHVRELGLTVGQLKYHSIPEIPCDTPEAKVYLILADDANGLVNVVLCEHELVTD